MVSLRQLEVLNCILEGSSSLNQEGTRPHRMSMRTRSEESASLRTSRETPVSVHPQITTTFLVMFTLKIHVHQVSIQSDECSFSAAARARQPEHSVPAVFNKHRAGAEVL